MRLFWSTCPNCERDFVVSYEHFSAHLSVSEAYAARVSALREECALNIVRHGGAGTGARRAGRAAPAARGEQPAPARHGRQPQELAPPLVIRHRVCLPSHEHLEVKTPQAR